MTAQWSRVLGLTCVVALAPVVWGCGGRDEADVQTQPGTEVLTEAVRVTEVELGRGVGADSRVPDEHQTAEFRPTDTIYASVATAGAATGSTLVARWTFEDGQVVDETSRTISPTGPAATEFHITKPDGFPVGRYQVEILLNGRSVERKDFQVR